MKLPAFSIIHSPPDTLILHSTEYPYHYGKVYKYPHSYETVNCKAMIQERIPGYNIIVALSGSLTGKIHVSAAGTANLEKLVKDMANWYTEQVINKQAAKFAKYKL